MLPDERLRAAQREYRSQGSFQAGLGYAREIGRVATQELAIQELFDRTHTGPHAEAVTDAIEKALGPWDLGGLSFLYWQRRYWQYMFYNFLIAQYEGVKYLVLPCSEDPFKELWAFNLPSEELIGKEGMERWLASVRNCYKIFTEPGVGNEAWDDNESVLGVVKLDFGKIIHSYLWKTWSEGRLKGETLLEVIKCLDTLRSFDGEESDGVCASVGSLDFKGMPEDLAGHILSENESEHFVSRDLADGQGHHATAYTYRMVRIDGFIGEETSQLWRVGLTLTASDWVYGRTEIWSHYERGMASS